MSGPVATLDEGIDLSKPLPPGVKKTLYIVYKGTFVNKETGAKGLSDPVCTRTRREDADSIATLLNEAQEGVFYLRFVASNGFPLATGSADDVVLRSEQTDMRIAWERIAAPLRKNLYEVAEVGVTNEADAALFDETVNSAQARDKV